MAGLKDRINKEVNPTEKAVLNIAGLKVPTEEKKEGKKYAVNVLFDGNMEDAIKQRAKEMGMGVATYIKMLVSRDING